VRLFHRNIHIPALRVIQHLEKYDIPENFYYERATLLYFKARYDFMNGKQKTKALSIMNAHVAALELYGCSGTAALCREEIENLLKNPEKKFYFRMIVKIKVCRKHTFPTIEKLLQLFLHFRFLQ
jgi:hypothetical protein